MSSPQEMERSLYLVLSPRSLPYARLTLESVWNRSIERFHLNLITDSEEDKSVLAECMASLSAHPKHRWSIYASRDLDDREAVLFNAFPNLRALRRGHPCWRKITDPWLLAAPGSEMVLLDPDLYFPNNFKFETTPAHGLSLMWQRPNCLLPGSVVTRAMQAGVPLAHHVDIGVAHWRGPDDKEWLEWLIGILGGSQLPRVMHVEAIVWSALAMRMGGGHLDPGTWHCWRRSQLKRIFRMLKVPGPQILRSAPWQSIKCFHGGGEAKWWLPATTALNLPQPRTLSEPTALLPFVELTPAAYQREQALKRLLRGTGYYAVFRNA